MAWRGARATAPAPPLGSLSANPPRDFRPGFLQGARAHKESDMAARRDLLHDPVLGRAYIVFGAHDLFRGGNVVALARQKIERTGDVPEIERAAKTNKTPPGKPVFLEKLGDCLQIPPSWQIDWVFVPPVKRLLLLEVS